VIAADNLAMRCAQVFVAIAASELLEPKKFLKKRQFRFQRVVMLFPKKNMGFC
jgi:hypothetical protein